MYEQPPSAMSWLLPAMQHMIKEVRAHIAWVDACRHGLEYAKSWAFISNAPEITKVATLCNHEYRHESIAGKRTHSGAYVSTLTAEYPASLAQAIMQHCSFLVTRLGQGEVPLPQPHNTRHPPASRPHSPSPQGAPRTGHRCLAAVGPRTPPPSSDPRTHPQRGPGTTSHTG